MEETVNKRTFEYLKQDYLPYIYRWGYITMGAGIVICFLPAVVLGIFFNYWPDWGAVGTGFMSAAGMVAISYVMQTVSFFPLLGSAGTYMANLSGNIQNMRVPCAVSAQGAADVEPGSAEGEICANIGIAVSTLINIIILAIGVAVGSFIMAMLPPTITAALTYLLPCLSGGVVIMVGWANKRQLPLSFAIAFVLHLGLLQLFPFMSQFVNLLSIILSIFCAIQLYKRGIWK